MKNLHLNISGIEDKKKMQKKYFKETISLLFVILFIFMTFSWGFDRGRELANSNIVERLMETF